MTAQITDKFFFSNDSYEMIAIEKTWPFLPEKFGLEPEGFISNNWRGFKCKYGVIDNQLVLINLEVSQLKRFPIINNCKPKVSYGLGVYLDLRLLIEYSGKLVIGKDLLDEYYIHMGFQSPHAFKKVFELTFVEGVLTETIDLSKKVEQIRQELASTDQQSPRRDINEIMRLFSLDYEDKWKK